MGRKANPLLAYYNQPERFAQLMNGWLFGGAECWKAEDIQETDRRIGYGRKGTEGKGRERYRDLFKKTQRVCGRLFHPYLGCLPYAGRETFGISAGDPVSADVYQICKG